MRQFRRIEYENLDTNYSYGNLAEDIWSVAERETEVVSVPQKVVKKKKFKWTFFKRAKKPLVREEKKVYPRGGQNYRAKLFKVASAMCFGIVALTYFACVVVGNLTVAVQTQLVAMQHEEARLIREISEMQIAVEQLKGPERIREIASSKLGMVVARDNVYVNASKSKTIAERYHAKSMNDTFWVLGK
ncbi:MAG: septum formation initiator family protein [Acidaminococcaceae bacterium]|nr:septum formation initiator family protein [Acidaminococcaceae bacterium]